MLTNLLLFLCYLFSLVVAEVYTIPPETTSLNFDLSDIEASVGIGFYHSGDEIFLENNEIYISVLGTTEYTVKFDGESSFVVNMNENNSKATTCGSSVSFTPSMFLIMFAFFMSFSGNGRYLAVLLLCGILASPVYSVPTDMIHIYLPPSPAFTSISINAASTPIVSEELLKSKISVTCQSPTSNQCARQICDLTDVDCISDEFNHVGVLVPRTGDGRSINAPWLELSLEYYSNYEGFTIPLQFIVADTQGDKNIALTSVQDIITNHHAKIFIGPFTSNEASYLVDQQLDAVYISPTVTVLNSSTTQNFISLSMDNELYTNALEMIIQRDFVNNLETLIIIHRADSYGSDIVQYFGLGSQDLTPYNVVPLPYTPGSITDLKNAVAQAEAQVTNMTAVVVIAYNEVGDILQEAQKYPTLSEVPWYSISLAFNPTVDNDTTGNFDFAQAVNFKSIEFRGSNVQDQTVIRTDLYEYLTAKAGKPLPSYLAMVHDAGLLIANTPDIFDSSPNEIWSTIVTQSVQLFGASGWLYLGEDGFRLTGDFVSVQIVPQNPFESHWIERGYINIELHKTTLGEFVFSYYDVTARQIGNYIISTDWAASCTEASVTVFTRDISRQNRQYDFPVTAGEDVFTPMYDSLLVYYNCDDEYFWSYCPGALYGSDTQCEVSALISKKRPSPPPKTEPTVCQPSSSPTGCVSSDGKPTTCPKGAVKPCTEVLVRKCCDSNKGSFCCA